MFDVATVRVRGPLSGMLPGLSEYLSGQGYRDNTVRFLAEVFARLSRWLQDERLAPANLDWSGVDEFLDWSHARGHRSPVSRRGMAPLVEFLIGCGVVGSDRFAAAAVLPNRTAAGPIWSMRTAARSTLALEMCEPRELLIFLGVRGVVWSGGWGRVMIWLGQRSALLHRHRVRQSSAGFAP
ncbi:MAG: hypothetical protein VB093_08010 [Propionicimonas sp.]|nr:hypothetical protein [Propionicimonas sp.]